MDAPLEVDTLLAPYGSKAEVAVMIRHLAMLRVIDVRATDELKISDETLLGIPTSRTPEQALHGS
jgi:hypothetical protein